MAFQDNQGNARINSLAKDVIELKASTWVCRQTSQVVLDSSRIVMLGMMDYINPLTHSCLHRPKQSDHFGDFSPTEAHFYDGAGVNGRKNKYFFSTGFRTTAERNIFSTVFQKKAEFLWIVCRVFLSTQIGHFQIFKRYFSFFCYIVHFNTYPAGG